MTVRQARGMRPSDSVVGLAIADRLRTFGHPRAVVAPLIASDALRCARRISFRLFGVPYDVPFTNEEKARFEGGDFVDATAAEVLAREVDARTQIPFNWLPEYRLKGKADAGYRDGDKVLVEVKSANERKFSKVVGSWRNVPPGPDAAWVVQAGLAALSPTVTADRVHIICVDNERYEVAEWVLGLDEPIDLPEWPTDLDTETGEVRLPTVRSLTMGELERQAAILELAEQGTLAARELPGVGIVANPPARDEMGDPWACRFCPFQPTCARYAADAVAGFGEMAA